MVDDFNSCKVSIRNRTCNKVAYGLASHGACVLAPDYSMFSSQVPEFVTNFVTGDLPRHAC